MHWRALDDEGSNRYSVIATCRWAAGSDSVVISCVSAPNSARMALANPFCRTNWWLACCLTRTMQMLLT